ncbi:MAG TPA: hypothetical protein VMM36_18255 [Opitutaceae bacterium]|nr:hypothetical protein [Opitutaceae bacterium]
MRLLLTMIVAMVASVVARAQAVDIRSITPVVNLTVPVSAFNLATGAASVTSPSAISTRLRSNRNWNFTVRSGSTTFAHTPVPGAPTTSKPVSQLLIRENGAGSFLPISTSNVVIASGPNGNNIDRDFDLRFDTTLDDSPGQYAVTLVFTLVTL